MRFAELNNIKLADSYKAEVDVLRARIASVEQARAALDSGNVSDFLATAHEGVLRIIVDDMVSAKDGEALHQFLSGTINDAAKELVSSTLLDMANTMANKFAYLDTWTSAGNKVLTCIRR